MSALAASRDRLLVKAVLVEGARRGHERLDALSEALAHRIWPARRIGVGSVDQRRDGVQPFDEQRRKRLSLKPARYGESSDRFFDARKRGRAPHR